MLSARLKCSDGTTLKNAGHLLLIGRPHLILFDEELLQQANKLLNIVKLH